MQIKIMEKIDSSDFDEPRQVHLKFDGSTLTASHITVNEQDGQVLVPYIIQPYKCLPDGTRENFVDADDAFAWAESNQYLF